MFMLCLCDVRVMFIWCSCDDTCRHDCVLINVMCHKSWCVVMWNMSSWLCSYVSHVMCCFMSRGVMCSYVLRVSCVVVMWMSCYFEWNMMTKYRNNNSRRIGIICLNPDIIGSRFRYWLLHNKSLPDLEVGNDINISRRIARIALLWWFSSKNIVFRANGYIRSVIKYCSIYQIMTLIKTLKYANNHQLTQKWIIYGNKIL